MSKRLETIMSMVKPGTGIADVGTDHAFLPIMLVKNGYKGRIIASDINEGPLKKARRDIEAAGCSDRIKLILCNGLDGYDPDEIDTIVIAGMGGDTITGILDRAEWTARPGMELILQPATKPEILRYWLVNNEYCISQERYVSENGTIYQVIYAEPGAAEKYCDAELFVGSFKQIRKLEHFEEVMQLHIKRFKSAVKGLENTYKSEIIYWKELLKNIIFELESEMGKPN